MDFLRKLKQVAQHNRRKIFYMSLLVLVFITTAVTLNYIAIGSYGTYIYTPETLPADSSVVGIVFGGGVDNGQPTPLIKDRLDTAARLLGDKKVRKLVVSGDNRFSHYNEPDVMKDYLVMHKSVDPNLIHVDYAGRSTYETCERAIKIFGLSKAVLISEATHLPRAIYTCRSFGIEAYGAQSDGQSAAGLRVGQRFREILTRTKATINIYLIGEKTVLGNKIEI